MTTTQRAFFEFLKAKKAEVTGFGNNEFSEGCGFHDDSGYCRGEISEIGDDHIVVVEEDYNGQILHTVVHDLDSIRIDLPPYCDYKDFREIYNFVRNYKAKKGE